MKNKIKSVLLVFALLLTFSVTSYAQRDFNYSFTTIASNTLVDKDTVGKKVDLLKLVEKSGNKLTISNPLSPGLELEEYVLQYQGFEKQGLYLVYKILNQREVDADVLYVNTVGLQVIKIKNPEGSKLKKVIFYF